MRARRTDMTPRVEMMPMIDVIFLLLTFFIYSMIVMRPVDTLSFQLVQVAGGAASQAGVLNVLSIDGQGRYFFNREPVEPEGLEALLARLAEDPAQPTLYIALAEQGEVDRGPQVFGLLQRVQQAGVTNIAVVGRPQAGARDQGSGTSQNNPTH